MAEPIYRKRGRRYIETSLSEQDAWGEQGLMFLAAFRYCLGRQTYMPDVCATWLIKHWAEFPAKERALVQRELEAAFARDDEERANGDSQISLTLGWDCDRKTWERVRALWKD